MWVERAFNCEFTTKTILLKQFFRGTLPKPTASRIALEESQKTNFLFHLEFIWRGGKKRKEERKENSIFNSFFFF